MRPFVTYRNYNGNRTDFLPISSVFLYISVVYDGLRGPVVVCSFLNETNHHNRRNLAMLILHDILEKLKNEFAPSGKGHERRIWFVYTLIAVIIPFTSSKTSNLLRCLQTFLGLPALPKNASTPSWLRPSFPGSSCGNRYG